MKKSKLITGLLVAGLAFTFSAFTNAKQAPKRVKGPNDTVFFNFLVQKSAGAFTDPGPDNPNPAMCANAASRKCIYEVTFSGYSNIPSLGSLGQSAYTNSQIDYYVINGWLVAYGTINALYWD